ncbi:MAG: MarR family winged helix-turn-helix transcriptional regulator [Erythrobacteraceae bacterium]|jgi:DNA-binding MarR family transcriptional regulator|nr:MarR family winged helix-turn-helix transcriptional regulator [Erythrobacteraceae bacterium]
MDLDCTCFRVKRLSRLITQLYDAAVRPAGLRSTQFSLLAALRNAGPMTVSALAKGLGADTTSISRALAAVAARGLVVLEDGADRRSKSVSITAAGVDLLREADPHWRKAQQQIAEALGPGGQHDLDQQFDALSRKIGDL